MLRFPRFLRLPCIVRLQVLFVHKEVDVFRIPPRVGAGGWRSGEWRLADKIFAGRCRVVAQGEKLEVRLEDASRWGVSGQQGMRATWCGGKQAWAWHTPEHRCQRPACRWCAAKACESNPLQCNACLLDYGLRSGELFGVAPVPLGQAHIAVEQAADSSRK